MSTLTIQRRHERPNARRDYKIYVNGKLAGTVANGKAVSFDLPAGTHTILAKIDWAQSNDAAIDLEAGQARTLYVGMHKQANWAIPFVTALVALYFALRLTAAANWAWVSVIPGLGYLAYFLIKGHKKYLLLEEQSAGQVL